MLYLTVTIVLTENLVSFIVFYHYKMIHFPFPLEHQCNAASQMCPEPDSIRPSQHSKVQLL